MYSAKENINKLGVQQYHTENMEPAYGTVTGGVLTVELAPVNRFGTEPSESVFGSINIHD